MVSQTAALNRGIWEGVESAVRHLAEQEGELYVVTGPAFRGQQIASIGPDGVLVPTSTWKEVYDQRTGGAGAHVCTNAATPTCRVVSVAVPVQGVGIDPFPALPAGVKAVTAALPDPDPSPYAVGAHHQRRRKAKD